MDQRLKNGLNKLINKHYAAVQTDTDLGHSDSWKLEKKAKQFWADYEVARKEFETLLEGCTINEAT